MSNKSGISSQVISLPQGGGAISGLGESFSPNLHTGTGNFSVPIVLPPGRNGFQPSLQLAYSTGNGNSPFGLGWGLGLPDISRKTSKGIPRYDDAADTFLLSGAEDLVPVEQVSGMTRYRPRTEGLFARIEHYQDNDNDFWKVWSKDGMVSFYGTPRPVDADDTWVDPAVIRNPANVNQIFSWRLSLTLDPFGNRIEYEYERDSAVEGPRLWDQLYLSQIHYGDYTTENGEIQFLVMVNFDYGDRSDPFSDYRSGFEIRTRRRCQSITTYTQADQIRLVNTQSFIFLDQRPNKIDQLPLNGVSLLSKVTLMGHDGDRTEAMPPLEFDYSQFTPQDRQFMTVQGRGLPVQSLAHPTLELADLFGNGLPDFLEMGDTARYWRNLGNGRFAPPQMMDTAPTVRLADPGVQLLDANGDGQIDLLVTNGQTAGYFPLQSSGGWEAKTFQRYAQVPSINLDDPEVKLVDLDGDGVTDILRSGSQLEHFFNHPRDGWTHTRFVDRQALETFPNVNFSDPRVRLGDLSGGGMQDILFIHDGLIEYWPNLGHGNWGKRISMTNSPHFRYGYDPQRILIGDVDGDGLDDLVYVDDRKVIVWINQSGNGWSEPIEIKGTPAVANTDAIRLVDLLGTGIQGILWSADANGRTPHLYFLDLTGGVKPYLLNRMDNHMGAVTDVTYTSSIQSYLEAEAHPESRWQTPLPFPVQIVSKVTINDLISGGRLTTEYRYHHGYWDGAEREFRGFGRVEQLDSEQFDPTQFDQPQADALTFSAPTLTKTWFHQGPVGPEFGDWRELDYSDEFFGEDPQVFSRPQTVVDLLNGLPRRSQRDAIRTFRGQVLRTELYALDGSPNQDRPYTVTESMFGVRQEVDTNTVTPETQPIFFPHALAQRTTQWERGTEPMTQFNVVDEYDPYGQAQSQITIAVPRGRDFQDILVEADSPYLATQAVTTYAQRDDQQIYIVDRTARTTAYDILNDGSAALVDFLGAIAAGTVERQVIGQTLNYYDGEGFEGLPLGEIGNQGAIVRAETLALTTDILQEVYKQGSTIQDPPEMPPYLAPGIIDWPADYPEAFRSQLPPLAGYRYHLASAESEEGYFVLTTQLTYDIQSNGDGQGRGLVTSMRDPLGQEAHVTYDDYDIVPIQVVDAVGLTTQAIYDYRVLQPMQVINGNGNRMAYRFTPLGLLEKTAVTGKVGELVGDTLNAPSTQLTYDWLAFDQRQVPISVRTTQRVHHVNDEDVPLPERDETIETIEYSDGFGRLLQTRTQAEDIRFGDGSFGNGVLPTDQTVTPGDAIGQRRVQTDPLNVVVSGWQIYDNKGQVVEKYEPFFSTGLAYIPPTEAEFGQKVTMHYDPRGQVIRTVNPDGSEQRILYGIPDDLANPDDFMPTPWEAYTYDSNDNAGRTHSTEAISYQHHWNTPNSAVVDALGRTVETVERNGPNAAIDWYRTRSTYDIRGNVLTVTDAMDRVAFQYHYDLADRVLRTENIDAGVRRTIVDAVGNEIERRDSKGALLLQGYDRLHRPNQLWARDDAASAMTLRERLEYGDGGTPDQPEAERNANRGRNRLGQLYRHYDEAGALTVEAYDFKGNLLEKMRQVVSDRPILDTFKTAANNKWNVETFRMDWQPSLGITLEKHETDLLDPAQYRTTLTYDALNRVKSMQYPEDVKGHRQVLRPTYNRAGALEQVALDGQPFVDHIAYNAKGQRTLITYGNGVMTRYAYDPETFRLLRLHTEHYTKTGDLTYRPIGDPLQDLGYEYDLAGNITTLRDRTPESGIPNTVLGPDALDRHFTYDPIYRLLSATGRECDRPPEPPPWNDTPRCTDITRARAYTEQYTYDPLGNVLQLQHQITNGGFNRTFTLADNSNRLTQMSRGQTDYQYTYDVNGNLTQEGLSRHFEWDHSDQMRAYRTQTAGAEPTVHAHYFYDASGQRVKKFVRKQGGIIEVTIYIDGVFEYQRIEKGKDLYENNTLHVMDDQSRIALVRIGTPFPNDTTPAIKYHLGDHLGSSNVVIDGVGQLINREEYTPYGESSFGSFAFKRYRFTGKERDEESGLCYHSARYYAPWTMRWISCDPAGMIDGLNLYSYVQNNPIRFSDPLGLQRSDAVSSSGSQGTQPSNLKGGEVLNLEEGEVIVIENKVNEFKLHNTYFMTIGDSYYLKYSWNKDYHSVSKYGYNSALKINRSLANATPEQMRKLNTSVAFTQFVGNTSAFILHNFVLGFGPGGRIANLLGEALTTSERLEQAETFEEKAKIYTDSFGSRGFPGRTRVKGAKSSFNINKEYATKTEMAQGVRELERGFKNIPGKPLPDNHMLTGFQRNALQENIRRVIKKTIPAVKRKMSNGSSNQSLVNQMSNPRFRFLDQVPAAKEALIKALEGTGVTIPRKW